MPTLQLFNALAVTSNGPGSINVDWPGGDGWLIVGSGAVFTGAAKILLFWQNNSDIANVGGQVPFASTINAVGVYPFSAPAGFISAAYDMGAGGTISSLNLYAVS